VNKIAEFCLNFAQVPLFSITFYPRTRVFTPYVYWRKPGVRTYIPGNSYSVTQQTVHIPYITGNL